MTSSKRATFGDILRRARFDLRFTQDDFAPELGISRRTLSRWEFDLTRPDADRLPWIVGEIFKLDPAVGERVAGELGVPSPGPTSADIERAIWTAAEALGVSANELRAALGPLVARWQGIGCTLEHVAAALEGKGTRKQVGSR
jgi:transcriptional regulator with XRE-family HTH domain